MTNDKPFDCVDMKHQAAEKVQAHLAGMSRDEKIAYFHARTQALRALQQQLIQAQELQQSAQTSARRTDSRAPRTPSPAVVPHSDSPRP